jgi:hypothetical protein
VRDLAALLLHLLATVARLAGLGGARSVVAESVLVKHQLPILDRAGTVLQSPPLRSHGRRRVCAPHAPAQADPVPRESDSNNWGRTTMASVFRSS